MAIMKKLFLLIGISIFFTCQTPSTIQKGGPKTTTPKNVILMIGDGMGLTQISAGLYANHGVSNLEKFKTVGLHKAYATDDLITDSAAGATAFACGIKTYNGAIAVTPDTSSVITILEEAEAKGLPTGMVVTSTIVHATPASFIAHVKSRGMYEEIAAFFLNTEIDFFVGGGKKFFDNRKDGRNIIQELENKGYVMSDFIQHDSPTEIKLEISDNFGYLTANQDPLPVFQGRDYLLPSTKMAIDFLDEKSGNQGFFLMIEGSQIDWGGHANNTDYVVQEMLEFDRTIGEVLNFVTKNNETLLIVTADHECGGFSIVSGSRFGKIEGAFNTDYHTGDLIPVFAYGPGSEKFSGIYENTAIYHKIKQSLQWK